jgi:hypothetical protein
MDGTPLCAEDHGREMLPRDKQRTKNAIFDLMLKKECAWKTSLPAGPRWRLR